MGKSTRRKNGRRDAGSAITPALVRNSADSETPVHYPRNRLVSKLLQDRGLLRIINAPRGYGKTTLAHEYVDRLFSGKRVAWVDASSPSFLANLDGGRMQGFDGLSPDQPALIVLDDVPWLHEERAATLSRRIDDALRRGVEILATTLPSCDSMSSLQQDRIVVSATDLEITEQECLDGQRADRSGARVRALRMWRQANETFMGRVPAVAWGDDENAQSKVLEWFLKERVPIGALRASCAIIVLGHGPLSLLADSGFCLRGEDTRIFSRDYPFLGIDAARDCFAVSPLALDALVGALDRSGSTDLVRERSGQLMRQLLGALMQRDDLERAEELLRTFCSDEQCARWLLDCGWTLVDKGEFALVDSLLARCPDRTFEGSPSLQILRSWDSGLLGDARESAYFAQRILRGRNTDEPCEDECQQSVDALAYLALVAFGGKGASIYGKGEFSSRIEPVTAEGFLARTVDLCSDTELERALALRRDAPASALEKMREPADEERAKGLYALFTKNEERLHGSFLYRLAFHLLCYVDSELLKPVISSIGCELVARSRRGGIATCSDALIVRDLWNRGFFGGGGMMPKRDASIFEGAGRMLRLLTEQTDGAEADIPWEVESRTPQPRAKKPRENHETGEADILNIRLFGSFEATVGDRCIKEAEWRKKSKLLVILLVLNSGKDVSRDTLFLELWPGMSRVRALDNFYSVWSSACAIFGNGPYLERQESFCRINMRYVKSDVDEFERIVRRLLTEHPDTNALLDMYARIEALYRGGLVPSEVDNQTINAQRIRYEAMYIDAMVAATDCSLKANDARLALWFARKAMETGQQREDLYEALARAQVAAGQRCSAIKTFFECRQYLRDKLGLDPSCDMQDLYNRLINVDPSLLKLTPSSFGRR